MQASPLLLGFSLSPATLVMTPSSTLTDNPQPTPQKPQIVVSSRAPLALPFSCTFCAVAIILVPLLLVEKLLYSLHFNFDGWFCPTRQPVDTCKASTQHPQSRIRRGIETRKGAIINGFLSRERITAGPGFNRWLIPPAALMVHLSIGEVYAFSVFKNPLVERFGVGLTPIAIIFSISIVMLGLSAAVFGTWVERAGPRGDVHRRSVLVWWFRHRGARGGDVAIVAAVSGIRGTGRHRARHRLYLAGIDFDQVVPRPARPGHRPRHHGLRWRRADRLAALQHVARNLRQQPGECDRALFPDAGRYLPGLDDDRRVRGAPARRGLAARRLDSPHRGGDQRPRDHRRRVGEQRDPHAAVLAVMDGTLLQRNGGDRHPGAGFADDPGLLLRHHSRRCGGLCRAALARQHGRTDRLVLDLGLHRT